MKLVTLDCSKCGAPLEGRVGAKELDCGYCGSRVAVTASTPPKPEADESPSLFKSPRHRELRELDRRWRRRRESLVSRDDKGLAVVPTKGGAIGIAIITGATGTLSLAQEGGAIWLLLILALGLGLALFQYRRATTYDREYRRYRSERRRILAEIAEDRSGEVESG